MTRLDDVAKHAGERGLVRGVEDGRARVNEGKGDLGDPTNVEQYKGNAGSPAVPGHAPYVNAVNNGAAHSPTAHAQVASLDANITANYAIGAAAPRPPVSGDVEQYKGNAGSPEVAGHAPYVDPVNSSTTGIHPGNGTSVGAEAYTGANAAPRPPADGVVEHYKGNAGSPEVAGHAPYVDPVNDGGAHDGEPADHSS